MRNPWRFSFDLVTGVQWVADVGQGVREEVDMPIVLGGNYGWCIYEGFGCTGNDPGAAAIRRAIVTPIFDYARTRAIAARLPAATFTVAQRARSPAARMSTATSVPARSSGVGRYRAKRLCSHTSLNVSSFGEDEQGELYVVDLGGNSEQDRSRRTALHLRNLAGARNLRDGWRRRDCYGQTTPACTWTAASNASWITISGATGGPAMGRLPMRSRLTPRSRKPATACSPSRGQSFAIKQTKLRPLLRRDRSLRRR